MADDELLPFQPWHSKDYFEQRKLDHMHVAISPFRYRQEDRIAFQRGRLRVAYGEMLVRREKEKQGSQ